MEAKHPSWQRNELIEIFSVAKGGEWPSALARTTRIQVICSIEFDSQMSHNFFLFKIKIIKYRLLVFTAKTLFQNVL